MINQKGQAFDVFKLLIAAVIAIAILSLLMPIIGTITGIFTKDPTVEARTLLSDLYNKTITWKETPGVTFSTSNPTMAVAALIEGTNLSSDQVCLSLGDFSDSTTEWEITGTAGLRKIEHKLSTSRLVKIGVECARDGEDPAQIALESELNNKISGAELECDDSGCPGPTCCMVVLRRT
ncbi:MAG: hypothetical protein HYW05_04895 [Candidatus Diapherotrites archaeon]|nr:hypothetical protein [Candidatus Diapherotrites archaeon]